jgi:transposase
VPVNDGVRQATQRASLEGEGEHGADSWHRGQARVTPREIGVGGDHLSQALFEEADIGLHPRQAAFGALIALLPELGRMSRKQIAALVGLAPYDFDSGKLRG